MRHSGTKQNIFAKWTVILLRSIALTISLASIYSTAFAQGSNDAIAKRFLAEAPGQWEKYTKALGRVQGQFSFEATTGQPGALVKNSYKLKSNSTCKLLEVAAQRTGSGKDYADYNIFVVNPKYAFSLSRVRPDSTWAVSGMANLKKDEVPPDIQVPLDTFFKDIAGLVQLHGTPLIEIVKIPEFRVVRAIKVVGEAPDSELVEVSFECPQKYDTQKNGSEIQAGKMVLDSARFWTLRSFEIQLKTDKLRGVRKYRILEFADGDVEPPIPAKSTVEDAFEYADGKKNQFSQVADSKLSIPTNLPMDSEFRLSAFGFKEPEWSQTAWHEHWFVWFGALGLLCLIAGGVFRSMRRSG